MLATAYSIDEIKTTLPDLKPHPANNMPWMSEDEFTALKANIEKAGKIHSPIQILNDQIIIGKNRYKALRELKEEGKLKFLPYIEETTSDINPEDLIDSSDLIRRNLGSEQKAAFIAKYRLARFEEEAQKRMLAGKAPDPTEKIPEGADEQTIKGNACQLAAQKYGSNEKYIQQASKINKAKPELLDFIINKKLSLQDGLDIINTLTPDMQNEIIAKIKESSTKNSGELLKDFTQKANPTPKKNKPQQNQIDSSSVTGTGIKPEEKSAESNSSSNLPTNMESKNETVNVVKSEIAEKTIPVSTVVNDVSKPVQPPEVKAPDKKVNEVAIGKGGVFSRIDENHRLYLGTIVTCNEALSSNERCLALSILSGDLKIECEVSFEKFTGVSEYWYRGKHTVFVTARRGHRAWIVSDILLVPEMLEAYFKSQKFFCNMFLGATCGADKLIQRAVSLGK